MPALGQAVLNQQSDSKQFKQVGKKTGSKRVLIFSSNVEMFSVAPCCGFDTNLARASRFDRHDPSLLPTQVVTAGQISGNVGMSVDATKEATVVIAAHVINALSD